MIAMWARAHRNDAVALFVALALMALSLLLEDGPVRSAFLAATFLAWMVYESGPGVWRPLALGRFAPVLWVGLGSVAVLVIQELLVRLGVEWSFAWLLGLGAIGAGWGAIGPRKAIPIDEDGAR